MFFLLFFFLLYADIPTKIAIIIIIDKALYPQTFIETSYVPAPDIAYEYSFSPTVKNGLDDKSSAFINVKTAIIITNIFALFNNCFFFVKCLIFSFVLLIFQLLLITS